jgi:uncharacterized repeat protein (TIGR01451 family)
MKKFKLVLAVALFAVFISVPAVVAPRVHAEPTDLLCSFYDGEFPSDTTKGCDLVVTKQVSINGGAFVDADTAEAAAQAHVGDSVQWKIVVTDNSDQGNTPFGIVTVHDVLPAGVTAGSSVASTGTYTAGDWVFTLGENLPATLILNSTAATPGLVKNTAAFSDYNPDNCDGPCVDPPFFDAENDNNTNDAFVNIVAVPVPAVVTPAAPTLVNTGVNPLAAMMVAFVLGAAAIVVFNYDKVKAELAKFRG